MILPPYILIALPRIRTMLPRIPLSRVLLPPNVLRRPELLLTSIIPAIILCMFLLFQFYVSVFITTSVLVIMLHLRFVSVVWIPSPAPLRSVDRRSASETSSVYYATLFAIRSAA